MGEYTVDQDCIAMDAYTASLTNIRKGSVIKAQESSFAMLGVIKANVIHNGMFITKVLISENLLKKIDA
jgi:hypothetical protein